MRYGRACGGGSGKAFWEIISASRATGETSNVRLIHTQGRTDRGDGCQRAGESWDLALGGESPPGDRLLVPGQASHASRSIATRSPPPLASRPQPTPKFRPPN